jgi:hypothetical protein
LQLVKVERGFEILINATLDLLIRGAVEGSDEQGEDHDLRRDAYIAFKNVWRT